jgi:hypothetical protein
MPDIAQIVTLKAENSTQPDEWLVTPDLARVLAIAAKANRTSAQPEPFDVTFTTMLYGFLHAADPFCRFFQSWAGPDRLNREAVLARKGLTEEQFIALRNNINDQPASSTAYTRSAKNLLSNARALLAETDAQLQPSGPVDVRHLMGAYIYRPAGHGDELESLGLSRVKWSQAFRDLVSSLYPSERANWDQIDAVTFQVANTANAAIEQPSGGKSTAVADPVSSSMSDAFTFDSDAVVEKISLDRDRLNMSPAVVRFARLLAAQHIQPPIALGLFGRWGSGKSFFMGMLRSEIERLAIIGAGGGYVANVVQVTFNAWHYQDTNLWASLAVRIYEGIASAIGGDPSMPQEQRRVVTQKLTSSKKMRADAERRRDEATERRATVAAEMAIKTRERQEREHGLTRARFAAMWNRLIGEDARFKEDVEGLKRDAEALGLRTAFNGMEDVQVLQSELKTLDSNSRALVSAARESFRNVRTAAWSCLWIAAVVAVVFFFDWLRLTQHLSTFWVTLIQIVTVVGTAGHWASRQLQQVADLAQRADRLRSQLTDAWRTSADAGPELEDLSKKVHELDVTITKQNEEIVAADKLVADAETEIQRINEGGLVYDFLLQRQASDRYLGQLGLISTIRQDFETLRALLDDLRKEGKTPIDRIILYVDDLDRCQPPKVVEVLQAVHLLLAFDIFNVVVGVDGRWLERSLAFGYGGPEQARVPDQLPSPFRPQNYLEKIFQIPYSLPPINKDTFANLVSDLLVTRTKHGQLVVNRAANTGATNQTDERSGAGSGDAAGLLPTPTQAPDRMDLREAVSSLFFEDFEEKFLNKLYPFVSTPRLAKRMVNVYRLLRAQAAAENFEAFVSSESSGSYRAALLLLAVNIGAPQLAGKLLYRLANEPKSNDPNFFQSFLDRMQHELRLTDDERVALFRLRESLLSILAGVPGDFESYQHWATRVGPYSFDWQLVGEDLGRPSAVHRQSDVPA